MSLEFYAELYGKLDSSRAGLEYISAEIRRNKAILTDDTKLELMTRFNELVMQLIDLQVQVTRAYLDHTKNT